MMVIPMDIMMDIKIGSDPFSIWGSNIYIIAAMVRPSDITAFNPLDFPIIRTKTTASIIKNNV